MSLLCKASRLNTSARICANTIAKSQSHQPLRFASSKSTSHTETEDTKADAKSSNKQSPHKKTQAELDKELQLKMQGLSGDGGDSGVEYEDGQPVSMKRSVKNNMFRYI
ncbi:unnamed protein product [Periconia digitata]|uniref:Uncharacterized protein n=1 Tax=Periconia digitata TaxID=1303443 RepID=A0A9W4U227_9PLEO|nr:unnamed protein product [Periconia digitata]